MRTNDDDTGPTPPIPLDDDKSDGKKGDDWKYVDPGTPEEIFDDMADEEDIAFNYDDYCYSRAQIMQMRILARYGILPDKVWAIDPDHEYDLKVDKFGGVGWWYHVAPVISVPQPDGSISQLVIDPSIADGPISINDWKALMHPQEDTSIQVTSFWEAPINPSTGKPFPGNGYSPATSPENVNTDAAERMRQALQLLGQ